eukprot:7826862-Prorocentrum_lima.AAC.1
MVPVTLRMTRHRLVPDYAIQFLLARAGKSAEQSGASIDLYERNQFSIATGNRQRPARSKQECMPIHPKLVLAAKQKTT